jgi:proteic killer suppression protein
MGRASAVVWGKKVAKQLDKLPDFIQRKFYAWATAVELAGIHAVRERPGFHDEPLKGNRQGQRSIRLNRAYRAIYVERNSGEVELVEVIEVNKHEY